jgi:FtsZ-binding cell division protein ZapB
VKETEFNKKLGECEAKLSQLIDLVEVKDIEIETLKQEKFHFIRDYKETAVKQIESLMEQLIAKDNMIQVQKIYL